MKTLMIEIPQGYEVESFDKQSGQIKFKEVPKNAMERIKNIDDVLKDNDLTISKFDLWCDGLSEDEKAYRLLKLIAKSLNQGWTPDWRNSNETKFYPYFDMSSGFRFYDFDGWGSHSAVGSRLCFKSKELAEYAGKQFADIYRQFMIY